MSSKLQISEELSEVNLLNDEIKFNTYEDKINITSAIKELHEFIDSHGRLNDPNARYLLWSLVDYVRSHGRFTNANHDEVKSMLESIGKSSNFSSKQKSKVRNWLQTNKWVERSDDYGDHSMYCLYDGPDDPGRYLGHGEFDTDLGYDCGC